MAISKSFPMKANRMKTIPETETPTIFLSYVFSKDKNLLSEMFFSYSCLPVPGLDLTVSDPGQAGRHLGIAEMQPGIIHSGKGLALRDLGLELQDQRRAHLDFVPYRPGHSPITKAFNSTMLINHHS